MCFYALNVIIYSFVCPLFVVDKYKVSGIDAFIAEAFWMKIFILFIIKEIKYFSKNQ